MTILTLSKYASTLQLLNILRVSQNIMKLSYSV